MRRIDSLSLSSIGDRRAWLTVICMSVMPSRLHSARSDPTISRASAGVGQRAVAVLPLGADVGDLGLARDRRQPPVRLEPQLLLGDVVGREEGIGGHVELDLRRLGDRLALHLGDRLGDHLAVQVVSDRGDVTRLRLAEQVAGTADLEVAHRDPEAGTELGRLADRAQPFVRLLGQRAVARVEQVGVGALTAAPDPTAQLVHLTQPEQVGALDHQRVDRRHVDARLDDRRAHEHVVATLGEVDDDLLQRALVDLPMGHRDAGLRHELAQADGGRLDRPHAVVDPEDLPLTQQLAPDRFDRDPLVVLADVGEDRLAVGRRRLQQREVADPDERHLQRARDRRGGERDDVDVHLQLLHRLLVLHSEALLLVDDEQAEVLERDVVGEQAVGADHAVDLARAQPVDDLLGLGVGEEPGEHFDADRVPGEAIGERVAVLVGEQRRRREHGDLLALLDRLERGPDRDLGLAEPDVAAHQAVHRVRPAPCRS